MNRTLIAGLIAVGFFLAAGAIPSASEACPEGSAKPKGAPVSPWGGKGKVTVLRAPMEPGDSVKIEYVVQKSLGTGTADFLCEVVNPNGIAHIARKTSTEWSSGTAKAVFVYPDDFAGSDLPCATTVQGAYQIQGGWQIDGYGVNGKTAVAFGSFQVE